MAHQWDSYYVHEKKSNLVNWQVINKITYILLPLFISLSISDQELTNKNISLTVQFLYNIPGEHHVGGIS